MTKKQSSLSAHLTQGFACLSDPKVIESLKRLHELLPFSEVETFIKPLTLDQEDSIIYDCFFSELINSDEDDYQFSFEIEGVGIQ
jgi:hypothetical protein